MSKEDIPPGGLLSKLVRFVRNPTVNWADLDTIESDRESQYSKQMLKEMIDRKRRNDFVRRREFGQLRKLRERGALVGQRVEDPMLRLSFFPSSLKSPLDRAVTVQKIDEIEAQMSMQWWKGKPQGMAAAESGLSSLGAGDFQPSNRFAATQRSYLTRPSQPASAAPLLADDAMAVTGFGRTTSPALVGEGAMPCGPIVLGTAPAPAFKVEKFVHDPDLEEAAIRFANSDYAGAESCLLDVLAQHAGEGGGGQLEIWMTLFDLYRATGQQDRFDILAIDFAAHFERSAPLWFSLPEQLGLKAVAQEAPDVARRDLNWNAPAALTLQSVAALQASVARSLSPWVLTWSRTKSIEDGALAALANEFTRWADLDVQIVFVGVGALQALLEANTQSGERSSDPEWWHLRLAVLRLMGLPDEFEMVALDYCVTYEVSPASWLPARCGYSDASGDAAGASPETEQAPVLSPGQAAHAPAPPGLAGHIEGDASAALARLEGLAQPGVVLVVPCGQLIRMDFSAAGSVLNWAAEQQAQGREVHFQQLHRLVAILFNVLGINEYAWVIPRKN